MNSQFFPLKTHPDLGYDFPDLPVYGEIRAVLERGRARTPEIRTTLHPDQFTLLSSPSETVTWQSLRELNYQAELAELIGADVINLHGGGAYGDKAKALDRLAMRIDSLPEAVRCRLTLENDDRVYSPADLLTLCRKMGVPLVYDVHHHRCLPDSLSTEEATHLALGTWNREPVFHISSPRDTWSAKDPRHHHDFIDIGDFPPCWRHLDATVDVEAKAKELAVLKLMSDLDLGRGRHDELSKRNS